MLDMYFYMLCCLQIKYVHTHIEAILIHTSENIHQNIQNIFNKKQDTQIINTNILKVMKND